MTDKRIPDGLPKIAWTGQHDVRGHPEFVWVSFPDNMRGEHYAADCFFEHGSWMVRSLLYPEVRHKHAGSILYCPGRDWENDFDYKHFWPDKKELLEEIIERLRKIAISRIPPVIYRLGKLLGMYE